MLSGLCGEELGYSTMRVCSEGESEMGVSGAKKNQSGEGAVRFWRRRERIFVASGAGLEFFWLKGKKMGEKPSGAGEGERLWSAGNQEKKTHWWG